MRINVYNANDSKMVLNTLYDVQIIFPKTVKIALNQANNVPLLKKVPVKMCFLGCV